MSIFMKIECDYLNGWTKKGHICKNLTKNGELQRSSWCNAEEKEEEECQCLHALRSSKVSGAIQLCFTSPSKNKDASTVSLKRNSIHSK